MTVEFRKREQQRRLTLREDGTIDAPGERLKGIPAIVCFLRVTSECSSELVFSVGGPG